jgi:methyl-accepting chemotaxis protein
MRNSPETFLAPAIELMGRLNFRGKFLLLSVILTIPMVVLATMQLRQHIDDMSHLRSEHVGLRYVAVATELLHDIQTHRGLRMRLADGEPSLKAQIETTRAAIARHFAALEKLDTDMDDPLRAAEARRALQAQWSKVQNEAGGAAASFNSHKAAIESLLALITVYADNSRLTLDAKLDSYYLMDTVINKVPGGAESIAQLRDLGAVSLANGTMEPDERSALMRLMAEAQAANAGAKTNLDKADGANAELRAGIGGRAAQLQTVAEYLQFVQREVIDTPSLAVSAADYLKRSDAALGQSFSLGRSASKALEEVIAQRIAADVRIRNLLIAAAAFILLLVGYLTLGFYFSVQRGLFVALRAVESVAAGNLDVRVESAARDETGRLAEAVGRMIATLRRVVGDINGASGSISSVSSQLAAGNQDLSSRTEEQASSLEKTAGAMEELTSTVKQNAENAKQANQLAAGASEVASKGGMVVGEVVQTMNAITDSSKKISDIIGVIDGIAFQTNILALNAAVEAARAGEQGRGFAVVASEVRSLAQRSAAAAKEIKTLIQDSVDKVEQGSKQVDSAGRTMEEIVSSVKRVADIMAEITAASMEQSSGIEQVNDAITQMDQVTQQNAALVEEAAAAAESMKDQAKRLSQTVSEFLLTQGEAREQAAGQSREQAADEDNWPQVERRIARAPNVERLRVPMTVGSQRKVAAAGGDDEWEEF